MSLTDFLFGKKEKMEQVPTMDQGQQDLLSQLLGGLSGQGGGGGALGGGMDFLQKLLSGDTSQFEQPLMREFQENIIPQLAERFAGAGSGAQDSSAFQQSLGSAGAGLSERLGALRGGLQQQGLGQLSNLMNMGLGSKSFENVLHQGSPGFLGSLAPGVGSSLGFMMHGGIGSGIGNLFNLMTRSGGR